jgi:hypothetical protein
MPKGKNKKKNAKPKIESITREDGGSSLIISAQLHQPAAPAIPQQEIDLQSKIKKAIAEHKEIGEAIVELKEKINSGKADNIVSSIQMAKLGMKAICNSFFLYSYSDIRNKLHEESLNKLNPHNIESNTKQYYEQIETILKHIENIDQNLLIQFFDIQKSVKEKNLSLQTNIKLIAQAFAPSKRKTTDSILQSLNIINIDSNNYDTAVKLENIDKIRTGLNSFLSSKRASEEMKFLIREANDNLNLLYLSLGISQHISIGDILTILDFVLSESKMILQLTADEEYLKTFFSKIKRICELQVGILTYSTSPTVCVAPKTRIRVLNLRQSEEQSAKLFERQKRDEIFEMTDENARAFLPVIGLMQEVHKIKRRLIGANICFYNTALNQTLELLKSPVCKKNSLIDITVRSFRLHCILSKMKITYRQANAIASPEPPSDLGSNAEEMLKEFVIIHEWIRGKEIVEEPTVKEQAQDKETPSIHKKLTLFTQWDKPNTLYARQCLGLEMEFYNIIAFIMYLQYCYQNLYRNAKTSLEKSKIIRSQMKLCEIQTDLLRFTKAMLGPYIPRIFYRDKNEIIYYDAAKSNESNIGKPGEITFFGVLIDEALQRNAKQLKTLESWLFETMADQCDVGRYYNADIMESDCYNSFMEACKRSQTLIEKEKAKADKNYNELMQEHAHAKPAKQEAEKAKPKKKKPSKNKPEKEVIFEHKSGPKVVGKEEVAIANPEPLDEQMRRHIIELNAKPFNQETARALILKFSEIVRTCKNPASPNPKVLFKAISAKGDAYALSAEHLKAKEVLKRSYNLQAAIHFYVEAKSMLKELGNLPEEQQTKYRVWNKNALAQAEELLNKCRADIERKFTKLDAKRKMKMEEIGPKAWKENPNPTISKASELYWLVSETRDELNQIATQVFGHDISSSGPATREKPEHKGERPVSDSPSLRLSPSAYSEEFPHLPTSSASIASAKKILPEYPRHEALLRNLEKLDPKDALDNIKQTIEFSKEVMEAIDTCFDNYKVNSKEYSKNIATFIESIGIVFSYLLYPYFTLQKTSNEKSDKYNSDIEKIIAKSSKAQPILIGKIKECRKAISLDNKKDGLNKKLSMINILLEDLDKLPDPLDSAKSYLKALHGYYALSNHFNSESISGIIDKVKTIFNAAQLSDEAARNEHSRTTKSISKMKSELEGIAQEKEDGALQKCHELHKACQDVIEKVFGPHRLTGTIVQAVQHNKPLEHKQRSNNLAASTPLDPILSSAIKQPHHNKNSPLLQVLSSSASLPNAQGIDLGPQNLSMAFKQKLEVSSSISSSIIRG